MYVTLNELLEAVRLLQGSAEWETLPAADRETLRALRARLERHAPEELARVSVWRPRSPRPKVYGVEPGLAALRGRDA